MALGPILSSPLSSPLRPALGGGAGWWPPGSVLAFDFEYIRAYNSLDSAKRTPDSILTYTSPSPKLVYGSDGVLRYAPHNLLTYSEQFDNAAWGKAGATVSANSISAPNGSLTADRLVEDTSTGAHVTFAASSLVTTRTISIYAKAAERSVIGIGNSTDAEFAQFDLSSGTVISTGSGTISAGVITPVGGGWYRLSCLFTFGGANKSLGVVIYQSSGVRTYTGDGTSGIYMWGAQLNLGATLLTYIPTTTAAVYSLPIDHNPTTFAPLGVLIEEQRTNLLTYSEQFDNAAWTKTRTSISANAVVAPDGTTTADKLVEDSTAASSHKVEVSLAFSAVTYTLSAYLKAGERTWAAMQFVAVSGSPSAYFDLTNGVVGTVGAGLTASIVDAGNGWYRCIITGLATAVTAAVSLFIAEADGDASINGDNTSGIYIWGAQLEAGAFPTSLISTQASQVTRAADQVSILTSAFGYSATAGTVYVEADSYNLTGTTWSLSDGTNNERIVSLTGVEYHLGVFDGGVQQVAIDVGTVPTDGTQYKCAAAFAANDFGFSLNGGTVGTDAGGTLPTVTSLRLGMGASTTTVQIGGHIKRLTYFPTRKDNASLQLLSAS